MIHDSLFLDCAVELIVLNRPPAFCLQLSRPVWLHQLSGKKFQKVNSANRLRMNSYMKENHSAWSGHGLGLQDSDGAVKKDALNLNLFLHQVDFAVDFSLHRKVDDDLIAELPVPPHSELDVHTRTCFQLFGHCRNQPHHDLSHAFAQSFQKLTTDRKLPAGTLVRVKPVCESGRASDNAPPEEFFFLGVLCKRPLSHVFMKAWIVEGEADSVQGQFSLVDSSSGFPTFLTSHQAFYKIIESCDGDVKEMTVSIFKTECASRNWGLRQLKVAAIGSPSTATITVRGSGGGARSKKQVSLPFGLKMPVRKKNKKKKSRSKPEESSRHFAKPTSFTIIASGSESEGSDGKSSEPEIANDSLDLNPDQQLDDAMATEDAEPVPPTEDAMREAKAVEAAAADHHADCVRMAAAAEQAGSFFNMPVGFHSADVASTGRSRCYHCGQPIQKHSLRFMYFWHARKPSRYMHASCVAPFVQADAASRKAQALTAITTCADSFTDPLIKDEITNIVDALLKS